MSQVRARFWIQERRKHLLLHVQLTGVVLLVAGVPLALSQLLSLGWVWSLIVLVLAALVGAQVVAMRLLQSMRAVLSLTQAYTQRHFEQRLSVSPWDMLGPIACHLNEMAQDLSDSEHEQLRCARFQAELSRFLRPDLAARIAAGEHPLILNGQRRTISVVFVDLVDFTRFAEKAPPTHVVTLMQELVSMTTELVFRQWGVIDKSLGDCVMAIFGMPDAQDDHGAHALAAAEDIQRFTLANQPKWQRAYGIELRLSIGVATGEAIVGDLGSETRLEYGAVGDVVSIAARLAAMARPGQTLLTEQVAACVPKGFDLAPMGEHALFGHRAPVRVLELR
ncbi:MAG: hypothetical protein JNJ46_22455 [Myxococcales bacterium]|nr:hypothetical protein [Myxococcales bacterium]